MKTTNETITIQKTAKRFKAGIAKGVLLMIAGAVTVCVSVCLAISEQSAAPLGVALLGAFVGFIGLLVAAVNDIGRWWHHG